MDLTRRATLVAGFALAFAARSPARAEAAPAIHVVKDPGCPCCDDWVAYLRDNGFSVTVEVRDAEALAAYKRERGIPDGLASCHTGSVGSYVLEGHVPVADIRRLLAERPAAVGLSVPGMVFGSPGMGPETERDAYDVILIGLDGSSSVYASYPAA